MYVAESGRVRDLPRFFWPVWRQFHEGWRPWGSVFQNAWVPAAQRRHSPAPKCADPALALHRATTADESTFLITYATPHAGTYLLTLWLGDAQLDVGPSQAGSRPRAVHPNPLCLSTSVG